MTLVDWKSLAPGIVAPLYRREEQRWLESLSWDTSAAWATIESARVGWGLPGFVCRDGAGDVRGWTYFIKRDNAVEVGGIVADDEAATGAVIDGLASAGSPIGGFVYVTAPGLAAGLARHRVHTERFAYLVRPTATSLTDRGRTVAASSPDPHLRAWRPRDVAATAALLQAAYGTGGHLFARNNQQDEWEGYVQSLVVHPGCGVLQPDLSLVIECGGVIHGVALVTALSHRTAHLAQLAVAPSLTSQGFGRHLVRETIAASARAGYTSVSLLVSAENAAACALYRSFSFEQSGEFLALRGSPSS